VEHGLRYFFNQVLDVIGTTDDLQSLILKTLRHFSDRILKNVADAHRTSDHFHPVWTDNVLGAVPNTFFPHHQFSPIFEVFFVICEPINCQSFAVLPWLKYKLSIATGHASGSVTVWQVDQDSVFSGIEREKF
jgi:hypothetical protein